MTKRALELISLLTTEILAEPENKLGEAVAALKRGVVYEALRRTRGRIYVSAKMAGCSGTYIYDMLKREKP